MNARVPVSTPAVPTLDPPERAEDFELPRIGGEVDLHLPGSDSPHTMRFEVARHRDHDQAFQVKVLSWPGRGKRWNLRHVPLGTVALWGRCLLRVRGRTGNSLWLAYHGHHSEQPEGDEA